MQKDTKSRSLALAVMVGYQTSIFGFGWPCLDGSWRPPLFFRSWLNLSGQRVAEKSDGALDGAPDYPMTVPGLSLGRCHTQGYVVGRAVASK